MFSLLSENEEETWQTKIRILEPFFTELRHLVQPPKLDTHTSGTAQPEIYAGISHSHRDPPEQAFDQVILMALSDRGSRALSPSYPTEFLLPLGPRECRGDHS